MLERQREREPDPLNIREFILMTVRSFEEKTGVPVDSDAKEFLVTEALKHIDLIQKVGMDEATGGLSSALAQLLDAAAREALGSKRKTINRQVMEKAKQDICRQLPWPWSEIFC